MTEKTEKELYEFLDKISIGNLSENGKIQHGDLTALVDTIGEIIDRNSYHAQVKEFHETFSQVINENPTFLERKTMSARIAFKLEELTELAEACGIEVLGDFQRELFKKSQEVHYTCENKRESIVPNMVEVLDALCDLQYFLSGTIVAMGLSKIIEPAFEDVHASNMSKACKNWMEAEETKFTYDLQGIKTESVEKNPKTFLVLRSSDKKVLKSINYRPANPAQFLIEDEAPDFDLNSR